MGQGCQTDLRPQAGKCVRSPHDLLLELLLRVSEGAVASARTPALLSKVTTQAGFILAVWLWLSREDRRDVNGRYQHLVPGYLCQGQSMQHANVGDCWP